MRLALWIKLTQLLGLIISRLALTGQIFGLLVFSKFGEKSVFIFFWEIQKGRVFNTTPALYLRGVSVTATPFYFAPMG